VEAVSERVMRILAGEVRESVSSISGQVIVVAHDLSPADTTQMRLEKVVGFATDMGSKTSHTAIIAQSLEIPAVVGLEKVTREINPGDAIILDGNSGLIFINPPQEVLVQYQEKQRQYESFKTEIARLSHLPAITLDGHAIQVKANIEFMEELETYRDRGAEGVGLYRTEFLYLRQKELPSEEALYEDYRKAAAVVAPHSLTIRTLDIGGDKFASHLDLAEEMNPAMGLRAIRFSLKETDIFKIQLRAILRASAQGNIRIMFPMISDLKEVKMAKAILKGLMEDLAREKIPFDPQLKVGIMIEVPSAVTIADLLAPEVSFFSIGTNDLIQYTLAIDRVNESVAHMYQPLHPAVLRMVRQIVRAGQDRGITVAMCGEMAGEPLYVPILLGLELNELSMNPMAIPKVKKIIRRTRLSDAKKLLSELMKMETTEAVNECLTREMTRLFPDEFDLAGKMRY
jgi:phosphotransferase system enzyme I (PtsI)